MSLRNWRGFFTFSSKFRGIFRQSSRKRETHLCHCCCLASKLFGSRARAARISVLLILYYFSWRSRRRRRGHVDLWQLRGASRPLPWSVGISGLKKTSEAAKTCLLWALSESPSWWLPWAPPADPADSTRADYRADIYDWARTERDTWCIHSAKTKKKM